MFFAALRAQRLSNQGGEIDPDVIQKQLFSDASRKRREVALEQTRTIIQHLLSMGLTVIIDTPKPVFRAPPFRCSDWFNRMI